MKPQSSVLGGGDPKQANLQEQIRLKAYFLSKANPAASPEENWVQAQRKILAEHERKRGTDFPGWLSFLLMSLLVLVLVVLAERARTYMETTDFYLQHPVIGSILYYWSIVVAAVVIVKVCHQQPSISQGLKWMADGLVQMGEGKTRWDWIKILGGPTLFGAIAGVASFLYNQSNQSLTKMLATEKEREQIMNSYISDMTSMLKNAKWNKFTHDSRLAISTRTLNTLEGLQKDGLRQGITLRFASRVFPDFICLESDYLEREPELHHQIMSAQNERCLWPSNISLYKIRLKHFHIDETNDLYRGMLKSADLRRADLSDSQLLRADLHNADLRHANLSGTFFSPLTDLRNANFENADIDKATFDGTDIRNTHHVETNRIRRFLAWIFLKAGINPKTIDRSQILSHLVGESTLTNSFILTSFETINLTLNPLYLKKERLPLEWVQRNNGEPAQICSLKNQGKISFQNPTYQRVVKAKPDDSTQLSVYSTTLESGYLPSKDEVIRFVSKFDKEYGCKPL
jgi:hypothetical protein